MLVSRAKEIGLGRGGGGEACAGEVPLGEGCHEGGGSSGQGRGGERATGDAEEGGTFLWFPMILCAASMRAEKGWAAATPSATKKVFGVTLSSCTSSCCLCVVPTPEAGTLTAHVR